jgi:HAD superfamily hydrolase (TIGR01509 family)
MIEAVLVEFDGVIADTRDARRAALLHTLEEDGLMLDESEYFDWCAAMPARSAVRAAFARRKLAPDDVAIELAAVRAERRFSAMIETGVSLAAGAQEFIESLHAQARLGIVSRTSRQDIDAALALARLEHAFEFVIAGDDAYRPKPAPDAYLGALDRLARRRSVHAKNVVALEDGPLGIRAAKGAGLRCAIVGTLPVHVAVEADALLPSLAGQSVASLDALTTGAPTAER